MAKFDICVIGGGPGGFAAAMRAWDFGKRVAIIEKSRIGGAGVFNGALSSKTLWELSRDYRIAIQRDRGYIASDIDLDFARVRECVNTAVAEKAAQLDTQIEKLAAPLPGRPGTITRIHGTARFVDGHALSVDSPDAGESRTVEADNFIIATGSSPRTVPNIPVDGEAIVTSDHVMDFDHFPRSLVIIGAGVVGCEYATMFANYGRTKVYLIDRADRILPFEDDDISRLCSKNLEEKGVTIHHGANLLEIAHDGEQVRYTIEQPGGGRETITVEKALVSIGRVPNTGELGLDKAGVEVDGRGYIVNNDSQTTQAHIYAVGDITADMALVSVAELEGRHVVSKICGDEPAPLSYDNLSTIMFLDPEVAAIGLNEQDAQKQRIPYRVAVYNYALVNRPIAMRQTGGFIKLLVTDDDDMHILGVRALGVHASTTIEAVSLMMKEHSSARELSELFHPHPAVPEGLQDCVRMLTGTSIYKPEVFHSALRLSRVTYDGDGEAETTT